VYSSDIESHYNHLRTVLRVLRENQLFAKLTKCTFEQSQVEYLGHIINQNIVSVDPKKIKAMQNWPIPKNLKQLRSFLGLTGYYRKFVRGYGSLAKPLTDLLKKEGFVWSEAVESAFNHLKMAMSTTPVLAMPDFDRPFTVETDACYGGLGVILMQKGRPIAYYSTAIGPGKLGLSIYEKELLVLVSTISKLRHYLKGHHFVIKTDHQSLKFVLEQRITTPLQQKWLTKLMGLDYEIQYKKGIENCIADALSRRFEIAEECNAVTTQIPAWVQEVIESYEGDQVASNIIQSLTLDSNAATDYKYHNEVLRYKGKLYIGASGGIKRKLIQCIHDSQEGGHLGIQASIHRAKQQFYCNFTGLE